MSTVEAIQASLPGYGIILYPAGSSEPPAHITFEEVERERFRVFEKANSGAQLHLYRRSEAMSRWVLESTLHSERVVEKTGHATAGPTRG